MHLSVPEQSVLLSILKSQLKLSLAITLVIITLPPPSGLRWVEIIAVLMSVCLSVNKTPQKVRNKIP